MRDALLSFHDGTSFTGTITPASTTRASGSAVLDVGKSGTEGLWVQLSLVTKPTGTSPTIDAKIQYSDSATFASGVEDGPAFPQVTGSSVNGTTRALLCQSKRRYWRCLLTVGGTLTAVTLYVDAVSGPQRSDAA